MTQCSTIRNNTNPANFEEQKSLEMVAKTEKKRDRGSEVFNSDIMTNNQVDFINLPWSTSHRGFNFLDETFQCCKNGYNIGRQTVIEHINKGNLLFGNLLLLFKWQR